MKCPHCGKALATPARPWRTVFNYAPLEPVTAGQLAQRYSVFLDARSADSDRATELKKAYAEARAEVGRG